MRVPAIDHRLVAITGQVPLVDWQTNGTAAQTKSLNIADISAAEGRTLYTMHCVADPLATLTNNQFDLIAIYGNQAVLTGSPDGMAARYIANASGALFAQNRTMQGGGPGGGAPGNTAVPGLAVVAWGYMGDGSNVFVDNLSTGVRLVGGRSQNDMTMPHRYLVHPASTYGTFVLGRRTLVFAGVHSTAVARQVRTWLLRSTILS